MNITTILGESREATRVYGDGSVDCPWCSYPIITPKTTCDNGRCEANPAWTPEALKAWRTKRDAEQKAKQAEEERRKSVQNCARQRAEEHRGWEKDQIEECKRRGACLACLFQPGWERVKFIKHRGVCPKSRTA